MRDCPELDRCSAELGEVKAALRRGDAVDARAHALGLERAVRRLRAMLDRGRKRAAELG